MDPKVPWWAFPLYLLDQIFHVYDVLNWIQCPFRRGRRYRVLETFENFNQRFTAGEILTFERQEDVIYDDNTVFHFQDANGTPRTFSVELGMRYKERRKLVSRRFGRERRW